MRAQNAARRLDRGMTEEGNRKERKKRIGWKKNKTIYVFGGRRESAFVEWVRGDGGSRQPVAAVKGGRKPMGNGACCVRSAVAAAARMGGGRTGGRWWQSVTILRREREAKRETAFHGAHAHGERYRRTHAQSR